VPADSPLGRTEREQNRVLIELGWGDTLEFAGPGAGGSPTAAALLGDLLRPCAPLPAEHRA
jgi:homoserine dehydrogenase